MMKKLMTIIIVLCLVKRFPVNIVHMIKMIRKKRYICRYNSGCIDYVDAILAQVDSIKISDTNPAK